MPHFIGTKPAPTVPRKLRVRGQGERERAEGRRSSNKLSIGLLRGRSGKQGPAVGSPGLAHYRGSPHGGTRAGFHAYHRGDYQLPTVIEEIQRAQDRRQGVIDLTAGGRRARRVRIDRKSVV